MRKIAYYVTGHGFGHARRVAEVVRALIHTNPHLQLHLRTLAPREIFDEHVQSGRVILHEAELDPGAIEEGPLNIDLPATLDAVCASIERCDEIVERERAFLRAEQVELIVSDIPFLAGDIADAAGLPCVAVSNFTWDWIYEPFFSLEERGRDVLETISASYRKMNAILHLPFGGTTKHFRKVVESPLVAGKAQRSAVDVRRALGISMSRRVVLVGMRGGVSMETTETAAAESPETLFLVPQDYAGSQENICFTERFNLSFMDLLAAADVVLSKLGYGILSDCISTQTPLLWPRRRGFREDDLSAVEAARYLRMRELPLENFYAGKWRAGIEALMETPLPREKMRTDGAQVCAEELIRWLE